MSGAIVCLCVLFCSGIAYCGGRESGMHTGAERVRGGCCVTGKVMVPVVLGAVVSVVVVVMAMGVVLVRARWW